MHAPRPIRTISPLRALAWTVLSLLAAGYLRVLVICSGPCCEAHLQLAFAERSCCVEQGGGCCAAEAESPLSGDEVPVAPRSCCAHAERGGAEEERSPRDGEQLEPEGSCCTSSPVNLGYGPLPLPPSWSRAAELAALPPLVPACAPKVVALVSATQVPRGRERSVDPPPLQNLRAIVSTTLLRI